MRAVTVTHRERGQEPERYACRFETPFVLRCGMCKVGRLRPSLHDTCAVCGAVVTFTSFPLEYDPPRPHEVF